MDKLKILVCAYRKWAFDVVRYLDDWVKIVSTPDELIEEYQKFNPNIVLLLGWSWKVPEQVYKFTPTICLHPSPLPKYRGGSPLQHQIINGEKMSAVTFFLVDDTIDGGQIITQDKLSLEGSLRDIFSRIVIIGGRVLRDEILPQYPDFKVFPQRGEPSYYKRREPKEGELKPSDFSEKTSEEIHNFIKALADPYPNAYVTCKDGRKLYLKEASLGT